MVESRDKYDTRHGGPFDRGSADSWYDRPRDPHFYEGGTAMSPKISMSMMSPEEIEAYHAGYDWNEKYGGKKY
jgi:hypothetical protein